MKHQEHIVCIRSAAVSHHKDGFVDYKLVGSDLMLGQRAFLEKSNEYRQVLPMSVFVHNNKVWTYQRATSGGEERLHEKHAICVGGHWDLSDLISTNSVINLEASLKQAVDRELAEEVIIKSLIKTTRLHPLMICADDTDVDQKHVAMVWVHELDGELLESNEDQLKTIGFIDPQDLLSGDYNLETWARIACNILISEQ
jgi:predicted NUDIX family phosphoesterase